MHSNPFGPVDKIVFVENYKECAICAILREKKTILGHTQRLKNVLRVVRCAKHAPRVPKNNANQSGLSGKKCLLCRMSAFFSIRWKFQFLEGWHGSPQKTAHFGATAPV